MLRPVLRLLAALLLLALPVFPAPSLAQPAQAPACGTVGTEAFSCSCALTAPEGGVWGTGPYTSDSNVCTAALHAGLLTRQIAGGASTWIGVVEVQPSAGCPYYFGGTEAAPHPPRTRRPPVTSDGRASRDSRGSAADQPQEAS